MTKIKTTAPKGPKFIMHSDDWDVQFSAVDVTVAASIGDVLESASLQVSSTSTGILGIVCEDTDGTQGYVQVAVRGTPSLIDTKQININDATLSDVEAWLGEKGMVLSNK